MRHFTVLMLLASVLLRAALTLTFLDTHDAIKSDPVQLKVNGDQGTKRDPGDDYHLTITHNGKPIHLHYRRNQPLDKYFPVQVIGDSLREIDYKVDTEAAAHQGVDHDGAVIIRENLDKPSGVEVEGLLYHNDKWLALQPINGGDHVLHEIREPDTTHAVPLDKREFLDIPESSVPIDTTNARDEKLHAEKYRNIRSLKSGQANHIDLSRESRPFITTPSSPGCQGGDLKNDCVASDCADPMLKAKCCSTCKT